MMSFSGCRKKRSKAQHNEPMKKARIMIVDDHPLVRTGFRQLIDSETDLSVCCEAADIEKALQLLEQCSPDLAVIDLSLPDGNGLELIKRMQIHHPHIPILVSSMHDPDLFADRALRAGAKGYINKQEAGEEFIVAARQVLKGKIYLSPTIHERHLQEPVNTQGSDVPLTPVEHLSDRELEIFELIGHGMTTGYIADKLNLSVKTIESHRANIKSKLGLKSAGELTRSAVQWTIETP